MERNNMQQDGNPHKYSEDIWDGAKNFIVMRFVFQCCSHTASREQWERLSDNAEALIVGISGGDRNLLENRDVISLHALCGLWEAALADSGYENNTIPIPEEDSWDIADYFASKYRELGIGAMLEAVENGVDMNDILA